MKWKKKGLIFKPDGSYPWSVSHAAVPIADKISDDILRIYYGTRDKFNRTVTTYLEVEADNPQNIHYIHDRPVLGLGELGCFDDSGAMPSWIVNYNGRKYLYYTGWNVGQTVSYRNAIGLAISGDNGQSFTRLYKGPIMDRMYNEPYYCAQPAVLIDSGLWKMWYLSCVKWEVYKGRTEPYYHMKYALSDDGINWHRNGIVCIDFKSSEEAGIVNPSLIKNGDNYQMWYSYRGFKDYRTSKEHSYRIGYAESSDGINWDRKDEHVGIDVSDEGWDALMLAYPCVYRHKDQLYLLYNGNGFGRSGFGYAVLGNES